MLELLNQLVRTVVLLTSQFCEQHVNGLLEELIECIPNGLDLIIYSEKEKYPHVEQDGSTLKFSFSLDLRDMEKLMEKLDELGFHIQYVQVMLQEKKLVLSVRFRGNIVNLIEAGWRVFPFDRDEMTIDMEI